MNVDKPTERFVRIAGVPGRIPLQNDDAGKKEQITKLPPFNRSPLNQMPLTRDPSPDDPPARPV